MDKSTIGIIRGCYQNKNPSQMFPWDNPLGTISSPKALKNCRWWSLRIRIIVSSLKLYHTFRRVFWGLFWNSSTKNFGKYTAKRMQCSFLWIKLRGYNLQPTTRPKTLLQITFFEMLRNHCKTVPFFSNITSLQSRISSTKLLILRK